MSDRTFRRWFWQSERLPDDVQALLQHGTGMPDAFFSDWGLAWHSNPAEMGGGAFAVVGTNLVNTLLRPGKPSRRATWRRTWISPMCHERQRPGEPEPTPMPIPDAV